MKYDFETIINRNGKDALAVDSIGCNPGFAPDKAKNGFDEIPMWIADMNFPVVRSVQDEIIKRVEHPTFGYFDICEKYYQGIIKWHKLRNNVKNLQKENIGYENGVLGGVIASMNILCSKGGSVLVHSPTYTGFTKCLKNNGYNIVSSKLIKVENDIWRMDFEDMEKKIIENNIHAAIFCSPHNPTGRVWEKEEILKAMDIFEKHKVYVISDEIWSDITLNNYQHIPTQSVSEYARNHTIAFYALSKTFNLAGLIGAYHIVYSKYLKDRLEKESSLSCYNHINVLSMHALIGAYNDEGSQWLDELKQVLSKNIDYGYDFIKKNFKGVAVSKPQGTYMLFLCCKEYCDVNNIDIAEVLKRGYDVGVAWQDGRPFNEECAIRINLALPYSRIVEAFDRMKKYVFI